MSNFKKYAKINSSFENNFVSIKNVYFFVQFYEAKLQKIYYFSKKHNEIM